MYLATVVSDTVFGPIWGYAAAYLPFSFAEPPFRPWSDWHHLKLANRDTGPDFPNLYKLLFRDSADSHTQWARW